jgi:hypothetical protein
MSNRPPLGANVRGSSAWIVWQLLRDPIRARIRQLELDPGVHRDVVRHLRGTAADLEMAALEYRDWEMVRSAADSVEAPGSGLAAGLDCPSRWVDAGSVAASLGCTVRWVTQLCLVGRLAAVKQGRIWRIDVSSVEDFKRRGVEAA